VICVDRALCSFEKHIVVNGKVSLVKKRPVCDWIGNSVSHVDPYCLRTLFNLENKTFDVTPPVRYVEMTRFFGRKDTWEFVHPTHRLWWAVDLAKAAEDLAMKCQRVYHCEIFVPTSQIFEQLKPWRIDPSIANSDDVNALTCMPDADGWVYPPTYNRFGTRTGRLTITHGPRVLTVKQDTRALFRPIDENHELVQFDFSSLEARVALALAGREVSVDADPYHIIAKLMNVKERDDAKSATFAALYSDPTATTQKDPRVSRVRRIFKLGETFASLKQNWQREGAVRNLYGRLISEPEEATLYNNYVQSTGADVVLLGFKQLITVLLELECVPHFLLHDALFVSVPKRRLQEASQVAIEGVTVKNFALSFPIKTSIVEKRPTV
jgi:hypothetical protein